MIQQKRFSLLFFSLLTCLVAAAQSKDIVKKSFAYYFQTAAGEMPKGSNDDIIAVQTDSFSSQQKEQKKFPSRPLKIDTNIVVYIEVTAKDIVWMKAFQNKQYFSITAIPIQNTPFHAGFIKGGKEVIISPEKGHYLFELQFSKKSKKEPSVKLPGSPLLLKGKFKGKYFSWKTTGLKEIINPAPL